jgi:hypothetical protein
MLNFVVLSQNLLERIKESQNFLKKKRIKQEP